MKNLWLFGLFVCTLWCDRLRAQNTFASAGAEWHHSMDCGVLYEHCTGDTVISGVGCRKISRETHMPFSCTVMGIYPSTLTKLYVYDNSDTVFVYNPLFHQFTPLYVFNVTDGDTVTLPALPTGEGMLSYAATDSSFSFRVDSVRMVLFDTAILKTVYTHAIGLAEAMSVHNRYFYNYGSSTPSDTLGSYSTKIGCVTTGLLPRCITCSYIVEVNFTDSLRCYTDSSLSIKLTTDSCDVATPPADVAVCNKSGIVLYPNPTGATLHIFSSGKIEKVEISNSIGALLYRSDFNALSAEIETAALPSGLFFVRVNQTEIRTFLKN